MLDHLSCEPRSVKARGERACHEPQTKRCFSWDLANRLVLEFRVQRESALEHGKLRLLSEIRDVL